MHPLITVIVPVYQAEECLERCVDSILAQTIETLEIMLIDDGCTDGCPAICDEYARSEPRVQAFHIENSGVSVARNVGLDAATGRYVVMVDSDDWIEPDYCEKLLSARDAHPDVENIWCGMQLNLEGTTSGVVHYCWNEAEPISLCNKSDFLKLFERWMTNVPWNKLFRRDIIEQHKIRYKIGFWPGQDLLFNMEYLSHTNNPAILVCNQPLYHYMRQQDGSLDTKYKEDLYETYLCLIDAIDQNRKEYGCVTKEDEVIFSTICFNFFERVFRNTFRKKNTAGFFKKLAFNNRILRSQRYRDTVQNVDFKGMHPLMVWSYKRRSYLVVLVLEMLVKVKGYCGR